MQWACWVDTPITYSANTFKHRKAAKRVLKYLLTTRTLKLDIGGEATGKKVKIEVFLDSDWAGEEDRKSASGCLVRIPAL